MIWKGNMIWKKVKKLVIPFMFVKFLIFIFFIFGNDRVSISRDINYNIGYQTEFENDSIVQKRTKLIRIVRNENQPGISIKLRGKKNNNSFREKEGEIIKPIVD